MHLPAEALQRTYTAGTLSDQNGRGCKTLENIHGQRADQSPKESGMCNKDKRETLWRLWGCEVNLNIFIRPSGGSYNTRSEMHALYTTFTLFSFQVMGLIRAEGPSRIYQSRHARHKEIAGRMIAPEHLGLH